MSARLKPLNAARPSAKKIYTNLVRRFGITSDVYHYRTAIRADALIRDKREYDSRFRRRIVTIAQNPDEKNVT